MNVSPAPRGFGVQLPGENWKEPGWTWRNASPGVTRQPESKLSAFTLTTRKWTLVPSAITDCEITAGIAIAAVIPAATSPDSRTSNFFERRKRISLLLRRLIT